MRQLMEVMKENQTIYSDGENDCPVDGVKVSIKGKKRKPSMWRLDDYVSKQAWRQGIAWH